MFNEYDMESILYCLKMQNLPNLPIIICNTKADLLVGNHDSICYDILNFFKKIYKDVIFFDISSKSGYNLEKPFLHLLRFITLKDDLIYVAEKKTYNIEISEDLYNLIINNNNENITVISLMKIFNEMKNYLK